MLNLMKKLLRDENGVILSAEIVIVGSILVIGTITGLTCLQQSVNSELKDVASAIGSLDQSYSFTSHFKPGHNGHCCAYTAGSSFLNCETKTDASQSQIIGCCNVMAVPQTSGCCGNSQPCGGCSEGGSAAGCGGCGAVGGCGAAGGCGAVGGCGSGHVSDATARCLNTGDSGVKATEWLIPVGPSCPVPPVPYGSLVPQADAQFTPAGHVAPSETCCESDRQTYSSGDLIIPDHVW